MKISLEWLKEYVEINENSDMLKHDLSMIGLLVEAITETHGNPVFEIEVTSNRPDCLSYIGIAREVAAIYGRQMRYPISKETLATAPEKIPYEILIKDPDLCPRYVALVLDGIQVGSSPRWMQKRLEAAGMRPLNNIVDITNYVLLELGHPLHAFDYDRLRRGKIVVARARQGLRIKTLDGIDRELDDQMLLINDGEGPVAIAGVMGGLNSEISQSTTRVLLESAYFNPQSIRRTSKKLGLSSEASYRYERGADWNNTIPAIARACSLLEQLAGGSIAGGLKDIYPEIKDPVCIPLRKANAEALLGVKLTGEFVESTLQRLNFKVEVQEKDSWMVTCPTYRADMELEADLIEELARFYGYQNIPATLPPSKSIGTHSPIFDLRNAVRDILLGQGYNEAVNLSFAQEEDAREFASHRGKRVAILNPLTSDTQFMRTTLSPGLVRSAKRNFNYSHRLIRLFEIGKIYYLGSKSTPVERNMLSILGTGGFSGQNWKNPSPTYDFFHLKGVISALLQGLQIRSFGFAASKEADWLNPADAARLEIDSETAGVLGSLSTSIQEKYKLKQPVYLAEIDFECLAHHAFPPISYEPLPKYPSVERDISIIMDRDLPYQRIYKGVMELHIPELARGDLIDVYEGKKIPSGKLSLTLRLTFQDRERTLTVDRVQGFIDTVLSFLTNTYGAELRSI